MDKKKIRDALAKINVMCHEVNLFIGKSILADGFQNGEYANKYEILPTMEVKFYLYNTETKTTACKVYTFEDFCAICSDDIKMKFEFSELATKLMDRTSVKSKEIIYIERGLII